MRTRTCFKLATNILIHSKLRSWLTIIGIVIGVGSVITIMALGDSMEEDIQSRLSDMDLTVITVTPGYSGASMAFGPGGDRGGDSGGTTTDVELTDKDIMALKLIDDIEYLYGEISGNEEVYYLGETASFSISGVDPQIWQYATSYELESGRLLEPSDAAVAVIGYNIANEIYDQPVGLNQVITINGKSIRVVGIFAEGESDRSIVMPIDTATLVIEDAESDVFDSITVKVNDVDNVDAVEEEIIEKLMISRHVDEDDRDFTTQTSKSMADSVSDMTESMTLFLGAIAGVSLLVGAVGIANTMFTSVMEKTKEIGTMKAIGATNRDIMMIFVLNSALVGFVGGVLGILLSMGLSSLFPYLGISMMRSTLGGAISVDLMLMGISIAVGIGVLSGVIPAYNASKMKPVDSLRYE